MEKSADIEKKTGFLEGIIEDIRHLFAPQTDLVETEKDLDESRSSVDARWKPWLEGLMASHASLAGIPVTADTAIKVAAVFACVDVISSTIASLPCVLYQRTNEGRNEADNHPLFSILRFLADKETTSYEFWEMFVVNLLLTYDAYAVIKRDGAGFITALHVVPTCYVYQSRNSRSNEMMYQIYDPETLLSGTYYPENIFHVRGKRFKSITSTIDPIAIARDALGLTQALNTSASKFFANGMNIGGIVEYPQKLSDEAFERFKKSFYAEYAGVLQVAKVLFLEQGSKFQKVTLSPEESQALESRTFQISEVCRYYRVPPHKVFELTRATFSNIEHQSIEFVQDCIDPHCVRIEQAIYRDLLTERERRKYYAKFKTLALLRGDMAARKEFYKTGIQSGYFSVNDVRELEDMNRIPAEQGGDLYMVNGNMVPLKRLMGLLRLPVTPTGKQGKDKNGTNETNGI